MTEPFWMAHARRYIGVAEVPGPKSNPVIVGFWKLAKLSGIKDDLVPWCAGFACAVLEEAGIRSPRTDGAKNFLLWGQPLPMASVGCIVVFGRTGGYHVGFVVGKDKAGNLLVLGGNQGDAVNIRAFPLPRVLGYVWPPHEPVPAIATLPVLTIAGATVSTSEA
jgi:uncharacterized protein (TIGR02594 family)